MKKFILLALLTSATIFLTCSPDNTDDQQENFTTDSVNLNIGLEENCAVTETYCAMSDTCGEEFLNLIDFQYTDSELEFTMYFNSQIENNFSLETLRNNFEYLNFVIRFPEQKTDSTSYAYVHKLPIRELNTPSEEGFTLSFDNYEDGAITGSLKGNISEMTKVKQSDDPNCIMDDIMGVCTEEISVEKAVAIDFKFCLDR
ncbi:hypothetical protein SAMN04488033_101260 [Salegentibacter agarivorans]|uniref:Lipoprotein n=1 Tax=Salegentibacter agarivorans TaxID=345907 RepID=A0A1I2K3Q7_9FLAO|nr:hypothetical protein [Salegentibacter agarivorans]SFF59691.1 hypothetical protein SAMN04488033_101260 [Salegentibacter agarivorans]